VEGLSVVVLTYYLANLVKLILEAAKSEGMHINTSLVTALLLPVLAGVVWKTVLHMKHKSQ
jgi:uncharacterized membrane-anchored protein